MFAIMTHTATIMVTMKPIMINKRIWKKDCWRVGIATAGAPGWRFPRMHEIRETCLSDPAHEFNDASVFRKK